MNTKKKKKKKVITPLPSPPRYNYYLCFGNYPSVLLKIYLKNGSTLYIYVYMCIICYFHLVYLGKFSMSLDVL